MTAVNRYLKIERASTSRIGIIMHRLYQAVVFKYLRSKGVDSAHEVLVNYPHRGFRVDDIIKINDLFRKEIEAKQDILSIPKNIELLAVDYTYTSNIAFIMEKLDKHYQSGNRMLLIVLLGEKSDKAIQDINDALQNAISNDDGSRHLENVRILTSEEYKEFLGFDGQYADEFDRYQEYSFNLFRSRRYLDQIRKMSDRARDFFNDPSIILEEAWINAYLRQS